MEENHITKRQEKAVPIPKNPVTCCHRGTTFVDLVTGSVCSINNAAVTVIFAPTDMSVFSNRCNRQAVLKVCIMQENHLFRSVETSPSISNKVELRIVYETFSMIR